MADQQRQEQGWSHFFGPFRLDSCNARLWRGDELLTLRPKVLAVLRYLVEHPGRLVTKEELLKEVWAGTYVTTTTLRVCIREIRTILGETARNPRFIETVGQYGYRFLAKARSQQPASGALTNQTLATGLTLALGPQSPTSIFVGRDAELAQLQQTVQQALTGARQIVFVTGEAGIGKTTVVNALTEQVMAQGRMRLGLGQCVEHYGIGEAYRPVLEALGRSCRATDGPELIALLRQYAPTWLAQMPSVLTSTEFEALQSRIAGTSQERMLRELAEALEIITAERPLLLVLEDLHWSDTATVELLAVLARRQESAHLLVLGTYRPVEVMMSEHPLKNVKQELQLHGQCIELPLEFLSEAAVGDYLARRFDQPEPWVSLAQLIHSRTDGNPLFMVNVVDALVDRGVMTYTDAGWDVIAQVEDLTGEVPADLRTMIEQQCERLGADEQRVLRAASVGGVEFTTAAVAASLQTELDLIEEQCEEIARRCSFITGAGFDEWQDGTLTSRYCFTHTLYQEVLYAQLGALRRVRLHHLIAERTEQGYGEAAGSIAAELAMHFEHGRNLARAVEYRHQAGKNALQRHALLEAITHLTKGLDLLHTLPETPERDQQELMLQLALGSPLVMNRGYAAPEVKQLYDRALALCQQMEEVPQLFLVVAGLWSFYLAKGELQTARDLAEQLLRLARQSQDPALLLPAHSAMTTTLFTLGEIPASWAHAEQGRALYHPQEHHDLAQLHAEDPGLMCLCHGFLNLWLRGYADQARHRIREVLTLTEDLADPFSTAQALGFTSVCLHFGREEHQLLVQAEQLIALSQKYTFPFWLAAGHLLRGWVRSQRGRSPEAIAEIQHALAAFEATGAEQYRTYYLGLLAEAYGAAGQIEEGLSALDEALEHVAKRSERVYEAEVYRLKGELLLNDERGTRNAERRKKAANMSSVQHSEEAETCFRKALDIARSQEAKMFELRATLSLSRLWQEQGKKKEAREILAEIYGWFTEGFETADVQAARVLLTELADV